MPTRRDFLRSLASAAVPPAIGGLGPLTVSLSRRSSLRLGTGLGALGVQLYTVRASLQQDFEGTLARVRNIGYREVEFHNYFGRSVQQVKAALGSHGLRSPGIHVGLDALTTQLDDTLGSAAEIGQRWVVLPWIDPRDRTPEGYDRIADQLNAAGERAARHGIRVGYHNHDFDLRPWPGGEVPLERLIRRLDPRCCDIELDLYWVTKGGSDPRWWLDRFPGRFPLVHVKDAGPAPDYRMADVGAGAMDWRGIFALRQRAGIKHYFIEHDEPTDPWASITASYRYLNALRV